jgi:hypothetical protein
VWGRLFGASKGATVGSSGAGLDRDALLVLPAGHTLQIAVTRRQEGKGRLPALVADQLGALPPAEGTENDTDLVGVIFDPDDRPSAEFYDAISEAVAMDAKDWSFLSSGPGTWTATRASASVSVRAIAWRASGSVVDGLPDDQNLERLLCAVAAAAYPDHVSLVAGWLEEIAKSRGRPPHWKAALHLWCAVIEPKATEHTAPARFLGQNDDCRPFVEPVLRDASLLQDLRSLFT